MKALKSKSLMSLIYAVLLALPLCAILSRVIYVQSNKNAYQSYSDNTSETLVINETNDFNYNIEYYLTNSYLSSATSVGNANTNRVYLRDVNVIGNSSTLNLENTASIGFYQTNNSIIYYFYDENNTAIGNFGSNTQFKIKASITSFQNDFGLVLQYSNTLYKIDNTNTLDNVFEYSVSQFVSENDFGQLNFFQWYDELLLTNNSHNALYIHFANWYLNYAMLISLMQILFLVLMWFVNFARKLLDRGMNYDW